MGLTVSRVHTLQINAHQLVALSDSKDYSLLQLPQLIARMGFRHCLMLIPYTTFFRRKLVLRLRAGSLTEAVILFQVQQSITLRAFFATPHPLKRRGFIGWFPKGLYAFTLIIPRTIEWTIIFLWGSPG